MVRKKVHATVSHSRLKLAKPIFAVTHLKRASSFSKANLAIFVLIFGAIGAYALFKGSAAGSVIPIPAANVNGITVGPGFVEASAREVVRTSTNKVYIATADDSPCQQGGSGVIRIWKGTGAQGANANVPTGFAEQDSTNHPVSAGTGSCIFSGGVTSVLLSPDMRLDSSNLIHMAYIDGKTGSVYYQTYSTTTDTWGARVVIGTGGLTDSGSGWPRGGQVALSLDINDVPHVAFASSGSSNTIKYVNKVSGTWSSAITVGSGTNVAHPSMVASLDGTLHLAWLDNSQATHSTIKYSRYSGSWGTVETVTTGDTQVLANGDDDQGPSIATDSQNRPHVLFMDGTVNGSDDYVRMRYRATSGTWTDNTPPGTAAASNPAGTWFAHTPQNYISSADDEYVFLGHDNNISPGGYQYQTGGPGNNWSAYATIDPRNQTNTTAGAPGLDGSASIRFDPLRPGNTGLIDLIYFDEKDGTAGYDHHATVFYKALDISSTLPSGPMANLWVDTSGGTCARQASAGTYMDASACGSLNAAYQAAQPGDLVYVKAGTYPQQTIAADASKTSTNDIAIKEAPGEVVTVSCPAAGDGCISVFASHLTLEGFAMAMLPNRNGFPVQGSIGLERSGACPCDVTLKDIDAGSFQVVGDTVSIIGGDYGPSASGGGGTPGACPGCANLNSLLADTINNLTIDGVVIHDYQTAWPDDHYECLYVDVASNVTIKNTEFRNCPVFSIAPGEANGWLIENSVFWNPAGLGMSNEMKFDSRGGTVPCGNITIRNNLISDNIYDGCPNMTIVGNIQRSNEAGCGPGWDYNVFVDATGCGSHVLNTTSTAVKFTNDTAGNFRLLTGSVAINAGNPASYPSTDKDGNTRPQGGIPDAGPYEFTSGGGGGGGKTGDLNSDNSVNILDLSILLSHYGQSATASQGDINNDGTVSITDLSILLSNWGL